MTTKLTLTNLVQRLPKRKGAFANKYAYSLDYYSLMPNQAPRTGRKPMHKSQT